MSGAEPASEEREEHEQQDAADDVPAAFGHEPTSGEIFVPVFYHIVVLDLLFVSFLMLTLAILANREGSSLS